MAWGGGAEPEEIRSKCSSMPYSAAIEVRPLAAVWMLLVLADHRSVHGAAAVLSAPKSCR